jgi:hypothetical protein
LSDTAASGKPAPPPGPSPWTLMLLVLLTLWMCNRPADPSLGLQQCGQTMHGIGVALEKFRLGSNDQRYPKDLGEAYPGAKPPVCPIAKDSTYQAGYQPNPERTAYLLVCKGDHHQKAGVPSDYPRIAFGPHEAETPSEESQSPSITNSPAPAQTPELSPSPTIRATAQPDATPGAASPTPNP